MLDHKACPSTQGGPSTPFPRRSFLQFGGVALGVLAVGSTRDNGVADGQMVVDGQVHTAEGRPTEMVVRRLLHSIESGDTAAIWGFFTKDGVIEFPFAGIRFTDFASFDAAVGPLLAVLKGLTFTDLVFEQLADPNAVITKYKGHATVTFNGKPTTRPTSTKCTFGATR